MTDKKKSLSELVKVKSDFKSHDYLCSFLEKNINKFAKDWLGSKVKKYKREWFLGRVKMFGLKGSNPRIDFMLEMENGKRVGIECKKLHHVLNESNKAPSQLLAYGMLAEEYGESIDELILIVDKIDFITDKVIKKYKLPIRYILLTKNYTYEIK